MTNREIPKYLSNHFNRVIQKGFYVLYGILLICIYFILSISYPDVYEFKIDKVELVDSFEGKVCYTISSNVYIKDIDFLTNKDVLIGHANSVKGKVITVQKLIDLLKFNITVLFEEKTDIAKIDGSVLLIISEKRSLGKRLLGDNCYVP